MVFGFWNGGAWDVDCTELQLLLHTRARWPSILLLWHVRLKAGQFQDGV